MEDLRDKIILMVIAPSGFSDPEYYEPKKYFESEYAKVTTASSERIAISKTGKKQKVDILLEDVKVGTYSAVVFVGGPGAQKYFNDPEALRIARSFYEAKRIVAAICIAPTILGNAGILEGKKVTSFPTQEDALRAKEANYTGNLVEWDGLIITANGPEVALGFAEKIAQLISENEERERI
ncbi:MAG: DJ-1/PfpI family protein [Candidatus Woesearchaeota archaeon]